ncbi:hypothetical protein J623_3282, partial [Acinetobacter sp. 1245249]
MFVCRQGILGANIRIIVKGKAMSLEQQLIERLQT